VVRRRAKLGEHAALNHFVDFLRQRGVMGPRGPSLNRRRRSNRPSAPSPRTCNRSGRCRSARRSSTARSSSGFCPGVSAKAR
jgi:hypothetical protein